mmetsp:Transcript_20603/g.30539  ORF Transcript_20603/g.30539 Transcript_20603/m.30539 type:complete len:244 (-) Transcript_20603:208-939(-)
MLQNKEGRAFDEKYFFLGNSVQTRIVRCHAQFRTIDIDTYHQSNVRITTKRNGIATTSTKGVHNNESMWSMMTVISSTIRRYQSLCDVIGNSFRCDRIPSFRIELDAHVKIRKQTTTLCPIFIVNYGWIMWVWNTCVNDIHSIISSILLLLMFVQLLLLFVERLLLLRCTNDSNGECLCWVCAKIIRCNWKIRMRQIMVMKMIIIVTITTRKLLVLQLFSMIIKQKDAVTNDRHISWFSIAFG